MRDGTIKIELDIRGYPFIIDACKTDCSKTNLSTYDFMLEEMKNCGADDLLSVIEKEGIYKVVPVYDDYPEFEIIK